MSDTLITPVETLRAEQQQISIGRDVEREKRIAQTITLPAAFLAELEAQHRRQTELGTGEKFIIAWNITTQILPVLFNIIWSFYMGNWKGIVAAVVGLIASIAAHFGFDLSAEVTGLLTTVFMFLLGLFIKTPGTTTAPETAEAKK